MTADETPKEMVVEKPPTQPLPSDILDILDYLSLNRKIVFKSQQIDDQELQRHEKIEIASELFVKNRQTFLQRFGPYLSEQHLEAFARSALGEQTAPLNTDEHDDEIQFMLHDFQRKLRTRRRDVKNRRYAAMQELIRKGEYFSEQEMMKRSPELYQELIGQYLSDDEKKQRDGYDVRNTTFSGILMHSLEQRQIDDVLKEADRQLENQSKGSDEVQVDNGFDAEDSQNSCVTAEVDDEEEVPAECRQQWGNFENEQITCSTSKALKPRTTKVSVVRKQRTAVVNLISSGERNLLRQEFLSLMHEKFLDGKDEDFDYDAVDDNSQLDDLKTLNQDEEDAYFEASDDNDDGDVDADRVSSNGVVEESDDELDIYMSHLSKHHSLQNQY